MFLWCASIQTINCVDAEAGSGRKRRVQWNEGGGRSVHRQRRHQEDPSEAQRLQFQSFYQPLERPGTQPCIELGRLFQDNLILTSGRHPPLLGNVAPYRAGWRKPWPRRWAWTTGNRPTCKFLIIRNEASRTTGRLRGRCASVLFLFFLCVS